MSCLTEKALAASLEKLLEKKTLDKITVKEITDGCGVNRQTFYYHFHDVYDLMEYLFSVKAEEFISESVSASHWKEGLLLLMEKLLENKDAILNAINSVDHNQSERFLHKMAKPALSDIAAEFSRGINIEKEDFDFVVDVFAFGFIGVLMNWIMSGMSKEYKKDISRFFIIIEGSLKATIENFEKSQPPI